MKGRTVREVRLEGVTQILLERWRVRPWGPKGKEFKSDRFVEHIKHTLGGGNANKTTKLGVLQVKEKR